MNQYGNETRVRWAADWREEKYDETYFKQANNSDENFNQQWEWWWVKYKSSSDVI